MPAQTTITCRAYQSIHDLVAMQSMLAQARSQTHDWRYWHIGELIFTFFMVDCHLDPHHHVYLWHSAGDRLVGYAILGEDPTFDWQVLPDFEWAGIENQALAWADARLEKLRETGDKQWGGNLICSARQDDRNRIKFLEQHGFRRGEYTEVNMLRTLQGDLPAPSLPAGFRLQSAVEMDNIPERAAIQREVWQPWTVGDVRDQDYMRFMHLPGYVDDLDLVSVSLAGEAAAYVNGWIDPHNRIGDFGPVGARPAYRRQGLTRAALLEGMARMRAHGMDRVCISTGVNNEAARRLYESVGFKVVNCTNEYVRQVLYNQVD